MTTHANPSPDINTPTPLLGGLSPHDFMRLHWQKKPLVVRGALSALQLADLPKREALFALSAREDVPSRLVQRKKSQWHLQHGAFTAQAAADLPVLPALTMPDWTLLVQGVDLVDSATHALMQQFRFIPDARLDDAMFSFATLGGGVGPHFDSYDVFLLQTSGSRRWRIGAQKNLDLVEGAPLKILADFQPSKEFVLEAGDMLYLPPKYAHEGVAVASELGGSDADCITCSIGFRAPKKLELGQAMLERLMENLDDLIDPNTLYGDKHQGATSTPALIPPALLDFAQQAVTKALNDQQGLAIGLGEYLSEPKPEVSFTANDQIKASAEAGKFKWSEIEQLRLDAASRMLYDAKRIFINGESFLAAGKDAQLMRILANHRSLNQKALSTASLDAKDLLLEWLQAGWCHV